MQLHDHYVRLARHYLDIGKEEDARKTILSWRLRSPMVDEIHYLWGELCEELEMIRPAMDSYARALRINPAHEGALFRLALLLFESGYHERSVHYLKKLLKKVPGHHEARELLRRNLEKLGLRGISNYLADPERDVKSCTHERYFPPSIPEKHIEIFMTLFSARETGYALEEIDSATGDTNFVYCPSPLHRDTVKKHILGKVSLGLYPLRSDNTVRFATLVFYIPSRVREKYSGQISYLATVDEKMKTSAIRGSRLALSLGIPAYPEMWGHQKYRLWFFFDRFEHFLRSKRLLGKFLATLREAPTDFVIEPLLPTRPLGVGWKEHPVAAPLGIDRTTGKRSLFLDSRGEPYENQLKYLEKLRPFSLKWALDRLRHKESGGACEKPPGTFSSSIERLRSRCPVVNSIMTRALSGHVLRNDEKVVLFYSLGLLDEHGSTIHRVLECTPDYSYRKVKNQWERLKKNPISCVKIRTLLPELTASVDCNCVFDLRGGKYPSPLLHISPHLVPRSTEFDIPARLSLRDVAERYVRLFQHINEERKMLAGLEQALDECFSRKGIEEYTFENVRIVRKRDEKGINWILESNR